MLRQGWLVLALVALFAGISAGQNKAFPPGRGFGAGRGNPAGPLLMPDSPAARLILASPEERERALSVLPPERQSRIREQLAWFDSLPEPVRQAQIQRLRRFASLAPEQKRELRTQIQAFRQLPQPRRQAVRRALTVLQSLNEPRRADRLRAPGFRSRFSPQELNIIDSLAEIWPVAPESR